MSQRGETAFVAMRVGRIGDPREVEGLADDLKVRPVEALAYVLLWEEFILQVGDAITGRVKGYRAKDIARKLTHTGPVERLIRAMETAGILKRQRSTFYHPYWRDTITGQYALRRAERRESDRERQQRKRDRDAEAFEAALAAARGESFVTRDARVTPPDVTHGSTVNPEINKERKKGRPGSGHPPGPPPSGGGLGSARWEKVIALHPSPMNPDGCIAILDRMSEENWALCLWVLENYDRGARLSLSKKRRAIGRDSHKFLRAAGFLQFRPEYLKKVSAQKEPDPLVVAAEFERQQTEEGRRSIRELLADPDVPEKEKARKRELFLRARPQDAEWLASLSQPNPTTPSNGVSN